MNKNLNKRILVVGGAGYIGSHACKVLAQCGYEPIVFDNLCMGHEGMVKWGPFIKGDILDKEHLVEVLAQYKPIAVMHFAAHTSVGESVLDPMKFYRNNVVGSMNLIEAMLGKNVKHIVFSSTCATFGIPSDGTINEKVQQNPINPYGFTKLAVERILEDCDKAYGLKFSALRYFNASGSDPEGEIGERHDPETHLIPVVLEVALGKRSELAIFGEDYPTPDGTCIRDYIHVMDLAKAHVLALEKILATNESHKINLGTGKGFSVKEIVQAVEIVTGKKVKTISHSRRDGDAPILICDNHLAKSYLSWEPKYVDVHDHIRHAFKYLMKS